MIKKNLFPFLVALIFLAGCTGGSNQSESEDSDTTMTSDTEMEVSGEPTTMMVDTENSRVAWEGTMLGVYSHEGTIELEEGSLEVLGDDIVGGEFVVDMSTMTATDENYNPEEGKTKEKLIGHLSSDDFFNVEEYPTAKFVVTSYDAENNTVTGDLTIRGNTHEETVENASFDPSTGTATGTLTFDRTKYEVNFQAQGQDMVLSDDIELQIELSANPPA